MTTAITIMGIVVLVAVGLVYAFLWSIDISLGRIVKLLQKIEEQGRRATVRG